MSNNPKLVYRNRTVRAWVGVALLLGTIVPNNASAKLMGNDYVMMNVIDGWLVWKSADGICGAEYTNDLGTTFSVAILAQYPNKMLIAVSNSSWSSMKVGQHYPFDLSINGAAQRLDSVASNGASPPNEPTLLAGIDLKSGLDNISRHRPFSVSMNGSVLVQDVRVPLGAATWVISCAAGSDDPFRRK